MVVPVTVDDANHLVHAIDLTHSGARIGGLRTPSQSGKRSDQVV
jgi:hypothetical protein